MGTTFLGLKRLQAALLGCAAMLACASAHAQEATPVQQPTTSTAGVTLETIDVNPTSSRLTTSVPRRPSRDRERANAAPRAGHSGSAGPAGAGAERAGDARRSRG